MTGTVNVKIDETDHQKDHVMEDHPSSQLTKV